ncbi:class I tRNA ligase family protein [Candidatus Nardonella dryophthoridicola]|uniref:class I tRNA ligase family protein n=1 Tax=Candidatus Nardonella dryophthoridicola TaxID=1971485 RepID=UPI003B97210C
MILNFEKLLYKYTFLTKNNRIDILINYIYDFIFNKFCNIYIEIYKINKNYFNEKIIIYIFKSIIKILHPIVPFITEKI